jgi:protoheme ferro-lyase
LKRLFKTVLAVFLSVVVVSVASFFYMNRTPPQLKEPNYFNYYKNQDLVVEGKVGIFISHLIMPEDMAAVDFHNLAMKTKQYIPWPPKLLFDKDDGVVLMDEDRFYEFEEFVPTKLIDADGKDKDIDGTLYIVKYHEGLIEWVPPRRSLYLSPGNFLMKTRKMGMPTVSSKLINKANLYYYSGKGIVNGKIPHAAGNYEIASKAMAQIQKKYGPIPWRWITAEDFGAARTQMRSLLDEGVDTVILAPPRPTYSHHEEFNGSFKHAFEYIHEWEEEHHKEIKVILLPQLSEFPIIRQAYLQMLSDRLATFPIASSVKIVVSIHGMAWDLVPHEAWLELSPTYVEPMLEDVKAMMSRYDFSRVEVVKSQDHFADPYYNPDGKYLSTNTAFLDGIRDGFDYVVNLPIEFFVENTDTMFSHAIFNFEGFEDFDRYKTINYTDWSIPYTREFFVDGTQVIYNGLPVGKYNKPIIEAFYQAMDSVLKQRKNPPIINQ